MILFFMSCAIFLFGVLGIAKGSEVDEEALLEDETMEKTFAILGMLCLLWALCVAVIVNTLSAYLLSFVFMGGMVCSWLIGIDREQVSGKAMSVALDVSVVALAFLHIVSYIKPR